MNTIAASAVLETVNSHKDEAVDFLKRLTLAESPSTDASSQIAVREQIAAALGELGFKTIRVPGRTSGGMLYSRPARRGRNRAVQLMLGHYDTVWPIGTLDKMPFKVENGVIHGPGVYDMKGGITQAIFALKALAALGAEPEVVPVVFFNSDEEIGSKESTRHIRRLAAAVNRVFVLEPSLGPEGLLKTARKGVGRFEITVSGRAAHAGLDPEAGVSAILELSHVIQKLFALNDPARGVTVNVGTVNGGLRPNVIAPESSAVVDVRIKTKEDAVRIEQAINDLKPDTPGTSIRVAGRIGRPALERTPRNQALWRLSQMLGSELGLSLDEGLAGGGSDGNTTSQYTATLDGLGPVGGGAHADHEHLDIDRTLERTALLALLLMAPPLERTG